MSSAANFPVDQEMHSFSQQEMDRDDYLDMIEGESSELIYEGLDFSETDPNVINRLIGSSISSFKEALIKYVKRMAQIFFTIDPLDLTHLALDLLDHYMNTHPDDPLPFDQTSGRSLSDFKETFIRDVKELQPYICSEESDDPPIKLPTLPKEFFDRVHTYIQDYQLSPSRVYQLDCVIHKFPVPKKDKKPKKSNNSWLITEEVKEDDYDDDVDEEEERNRGFDYTTMQICANAEGLSFDSLVERNYDLNKDSLKDFLIRLKERTKPCTRNPVLVLLCRKVNALTLDMLYDCENEGILFCAFPAFCKEVQPLSCHVIPLIKQTFDAKIQEHLTVHTTAPSPENVELLMKSILVQVQEDKIDQLKKDFQTCLQLDDIWTVSQEMEVQESCSTSSKKKNSNLLGVKTRSKAVV